MNLKELLILAWKIQHLQFEYFQHIKYKVKYGYLFLIIFLLIGAFLLSPYVALGIIPCLLSWDYFVLLDGKKRVYEVVYSPKCWERVGTLLATLLALLVIVVLAVCC